MTQTNAKSEYTLAIESLAYGPYGIGRHQGQVIMIPATVPGDRVSVRIVESKGNYSVGESVRLLEPSPQRQIPPCPYFSECGGCPWQHVRYAAQLKAKEKSVEDALKRIGKLNGFELRPIIPLPNEYHYRRRIRLQLDSSKRLGFYHASSHRVVEIESCLIASEEAESLIGILRDWTRALRTDIDQIEIVTGDASDEIVIVIKTSTKLIPRDQAQCSRLLEQQPRIRGLVLTGPDWRQTWGHIKISVNTGNQLRLVVDADVFTQVSREGNQTVVRELLNAGGFDDKDRVLELYCGAGNFTLSIAKRSREVIAVDGYGPSIESGELSAHLNELDNIRWMVAPVRAAVQRLAKGRETFSKIILNPPRGGAKGIDYELSSFEAEKILYVSCNPTTLARDMAALTKRGYKLTHVQPIDLFPHTFHVETLAVMDRE